MSDQVDPSEFGQLAAPAAPAAPVVDPSEFATLNAPAAPAENLDAPTPFLDPINRAATALKENPARDAQLEAQRRAVEHAAFEKAHPYISQVGHQFASGIEGPIQAWDEADKAPGTWDPALTAGLKTAGSIAFAIPAAVTAPLAPVFNWAGEKIDENFAKPWAWLAAGMPETTKLKQGQRPEMPGEGAQGVQSVRATGNLAAQYALAKVGGKAVEAAVPAARGFMRQANTAEAFRGDPGMRYKFTDAASEHPVDNSARPDVPVQGEAVAHPQAGEPFKTTEPATVDPSEFGVLSQIPPPRVAPVRGIVTPAEAPAAPGSTPEPTPADAQAAPVQPNAAPAAPIPTAGEGVTELGSGGGPAIKQAIEAAQKGGGIGTKLFGRAVNWFKTQGPAGVELSNKVGDVVSQRDAIRGREALDYNKARDALTPNQRRAAADPTTGFKAWMEGTKTPPEWARPLVEGGKKAWDRFADVLNESGSRIVEERSGDKIPNPLPKGWIIKEKTPGKFVTGEDGDFTSEPGKYSVVRPIEKGARKFPTSPTPEAYAALKAEGAVEGAKLAEGKALAIEEAKADGEEIDAKEIKARAQEYAADSRGPITKKFMDANPQLEGENPFAVNPKGDSINVARQRSAIESYFAGNERAHVYEWPDELQNQNSLDAFDRYLDRSAQNAAEHKVFKYRYTDEKGEIPGDGTSIKNEGDFRRLLDRMKEEGGKSQTAEDIATRLFGRNKLDAETSEGLRQFTQATGAESAVTKLAGSVNNYFMHAMHGVAGVARMGLPTYGKGLVKALADYGESRSSALERGVLRSGDDVIRVMGQDNPDLQEYAKPTGALAVTKKGVNALSTAARVLTKPNQWIVDVAKMAANNASDEHLQNIHEALGRGGKLARASGRDASWAQREMTRLDLSPQDMAKIHSGEIDQALRDKVAQNVAGATNFSAKATDKPAWMGKAAVQPLTTFKGVHVAAMREFADNALREAVNGNMKPLVTMTAGAIALYQASKATQEAMVGPKRDDTPSLSEIKTPSDLVMFSLHALGAEGASGFIAPAAESVVPNAKGKIAAGQEIARTLTPPWASDLVNALNWSDFDKEFHKLTPQAAKAWDAARFRTSLDFVRGKMAAATKDENTQAKKGQAQRVEWLRGRLRDLQPTKE